MKQLKFFMFILLAINIFSCYSINTDCDDCDNDGTDNNDDIIEQGDIIWERTAGPPISSVEVLTAWKITVASNGNIWAYQYDNFDGDVLYLSTNSGDSWTKKSNRLFIGIYSLYVSPVNDYLFANTVSGLFRSTDDGASWENIMHYANVTGIIIAASGEIYMGYQKVDVREAVCYYSNDNGNTWIEKSNGLNDSFQPVAIGKDGTLYANSVNGAYHSTDGGNTWLPSSNYNNVFRNLAICNDGSILGIVENVTILKSTDKGVSWTILGKLNTNISINFFAFDAIIIYNNVTNDIFVEIRHGRDEPYHIVYRSTNSGKNWKSENNGLPLSPYNDDLSITLNPNTGQMFVSTSRGVYRTKNYPK